MKALEIRKFIEVLNSHDVYFKLEDELSKLEELATVGQMFLDKWEEYRNQVRKDKAEELVIEVWARDSNSDNFLDNISDLDKNIIREIRHK